MFVSQLRLTLVALWPDHFTSDRTKIRGKGMAKQASSKIKVGYL